MSKVADSVKNLGTNNGAKGNNLSDVSKSENFSAFDTNHVRQQS